MRLIADLLRSDAAGPASVYAVAATQLGHISIGFATAELVLRAGGGWPLACGLTAALWPLAWEARQYLSDAGAGHRVRRRWDWAADGACYALGSAGAACGGGVVAWGAFLAASGVLAAALGLAFGRPASDAE